MAQTHEQTFHLPKFVQVCMRDIVVHLHRRDRTFQDTCTIWTGETILKLFWQNDGEKDQEIERLTELGLFTIADDGCAFSFGAQGSSVSVCFERNESTIGDQFIVTIDYRDKNSLLSEMRASAQFDVNATDFSQSGVDVVVNFILDAYFSRRRYA